MRSKNRQLLEADKGYILWLFDFRCGKCGKPGMGFWNIHEITPVSHGKLSLEITNRIPLCMTSQNGFQKEGCHEWAHRVGTKISIPILQALRKKMVDRKWEQVSVKNQKTY